MTQLRSLWFLAPLALVALALPSSASPPDAKDEHIEFLKKSIKEKRAELMDMSKRHQREVESLLQEIRSSDKRMVEVQRERDALLKKVAGKGGAPSKTYSFNLEGPRTLSLSEAIKELKPLGLKFKLEGLSGKEQVSLRLEGVSAKQLVRAVALNLRAKGKPTTWIDVTSSKAGEVVTFKRK